jgi:tetratricopeptide (TPR) repeat protein
VHAELVDGRVGTTVWSRDLAVSPEMFRDAQAQLVSGVIQRLMGSVPRGVRERLGRSMDRDPAAYELFIRGANAWHSTDPERQELAIPLLERAVELDSTLATAWVALGAARLDGIYRGIDADTALASVQRCFETAQRLEPGLPVVERGLIHLATETGGREQAEYVLEIAATALARDPHDVDQLTTAAWGFTQGGQADLAVPVIQRALRLDPGNRGLAWYRVLALAWAGMPFRCLASGAEFIRRYGEDAQVYACMGGANLKLRRFREAIPFLERAVELHGPGSWHYSKNVLVKAYRFAGDSAKFRAASREVIEELEMRLTGNPMNMRLLSGLATAYELAGDTHRLRSLLDPLTRDLSGLDLGGWKSPGARPDFGYSLMILLARTGRLAEARQVAASLSPDDQDQWSVTRDTLGVPALPEDEGLRALWRAPEYRALVEGQHARQQALFERYRPIVARFLAEEPDLPRPRTTWPAN